MNIKFLAQMIFAVFLTTAASSQSGILEAYINEGLKSNLQFQREQLSLDKSFSSLSQSRSLFFPQASLSASYTLANGGRKIEIPVGDLMNPVYQALGFPNRVSNVNQQFLPNNFHDTKIRFIQPLFNSDIYYGYKAQKELISVQKAQKNAYENELRYAIASAYFQYLQSEEAISILNNTKTFLGELIQLNGKLVSNSKVTRDVLLASEFEYSKIEQQIAEADKNNQAAQAYFNFLLNRQWSEEIIKDSTLAIGMINSDGLQSLTNRAWTNRQEIKQLEGAARANAQLVNMANANKFLPRLSAVADLGYQGFEYKFNKEQQYVLGQFTLTWDLFKAGERQSKFKQSQLDQQLLENKLAQTRKQIELEVINASNELNATEKAYLSSQAGVRSAEKAFHIINAKYKEGQALLIELLDARNKLTMALLTLSVNQYELLRKEAALEKAIAGI